MEDYSSIGHEVTCYNVDKVLIQAHATVSEQAFLCTASHDIMDPHMRLTTAPIVIGEGAWVCARAFICPGITVGTGAVVAAAALAVKDVPPWTVVGGNPASAIKKRVLAGENRQQ